MHPRRACPGSARRGGRASCLSMQGMLARVFTDPSAVTADITAPARTSSHGSTTDHRKRKKMRPR
jgi:hypothetical protein